MTFCPPSVHGYNWAPLKVGLYVPYFCTGLSLEELAGQVYLVANEGDAASFKLVVYKRNE